MPVNETFCLDSLIKQRDMILSKEVKRRHTINLCVLDYNIADDF